MPIKIGEVIAPITAHIIPSKPHSLFFSLNIEIIPKSKANGDNKKLMRNIPIIPITKLTMPKVAAPDPIVTFIFLLESLLSDISLSYTIYIIKNYRNFRRQQINVLVYN